MLPYTTVQALGQARLAEMHRQAQRDALARTARRARRQHSTTHAPGAPGRPNPLGSPPGPRAGEPVMAPPVTVALRRMGAAVSIVGGRPVRAIRRRFLDHREITFTGSR